MPNTTAEIHDDPNTEAAIAALAAIMVTSGTAMIDEVIANYRIRIPEANISLKCVADDFGLCIQDEFIASVSITATTDRGFAINYSTGGRRDYRAIREFGRYLMDCAALCERIEMAIGDVIDAYKSSTTSKAQDVFMAATRRARPVLIQYLRTRQDDFVDVNGKPVSPRIYV